MTLRVLAYHALPVIAEMVRVMDAPALGVQAMLGLVLGLMWDAARGAGTEVGIVVVAVAAMLSSPVLSSLVLRVTAAVDRAERPGRG